MGRQSDPEVNVREAKARFAEVLRARLIELGVEGGHELWLQKNANVRWQTAQRWLRGETFPKTHNVPLLAAVLKMPPARLLGPMVSELEPKSEGWQKFLATSEGQSLTAEERWTLVLSQWVNEPTVADYRGLLALHRNNAERAK